MTNNEINEGSSWGLERQPRESSAHSSRPSVNALLTLLAAARNDADREFCDGYAAAVDTRLATLRSLLRAEADQAQREQAAGRETEKEAS